MPDVSQLFAPQNPLWLIVHPRSFELLARYFPYFELSSCHFEPVSESRRVQPRLVSSLLLWLKKQVVVAANFEEGVRSSGAEQIYKP
jgi:hypothetical protein